MNWLWDEERTFGDVIALCHSELSEALEEYRANRPMVWYACNEVDPSTGHCSPADEFECLNHGNEDCCKYRGTKPEGIAVEMIDCIAKKHAYNRTRPYKHGGKRI